MYPVTVVGTRLCEIFSHPFFYFSFGGVFYFYRSRPRLRKDIIFSWNVMDVYTYRWICMYLWVNDVGNESSNSKNKMQLLQHMPKKIPRKYQQYCAIDAVASLDSKWIPMHYVWCFIQIGCNANPCTIEATAPKEAIPK